MVEGVNAVYIKPVGCSFVWKNEYFDEDIPEDDLNKKTIQCCHYGTKTLTPDFTNVGVYCGKHGKIVLSKHAKDLKDKQKQEKLAAKLKEKEDKALAKASYKEENVVISSDKWCVEILKTGDRKGQQCSSNKMDGQDRCKRHYNLLIKKNL